MLSNKSFIILSVTLLIFITKCECGPADRLKEILLDFRKRMCHPIPSLGLPVLDPYENDVVNFSVSEKRFGHMEGNLWRMKISNLSDFIINELTFSVLSLKFNFNITIPQFEFKTAYGLKGMISDLFPIDGAGFMFIQVHGLTISVKGRLKVTESSSIYLGELKIQPTLSRISGTVGNFAPSKEINEVIDNLLNEKGPEIMNSVWKDYDELFTQMVENFSKEMGKNVTVNDIISAKPVFSPTDPPPDCK